MNIKSIKSFDAKMLGAILIPTLIVFGSISTLTILEHRDALTESMKSKASTVIKMLSKISVSSFQNFEYTALDEMAAEASKDPEIAFVSFLDEGKNFLTEPVNKPDDVNSILVFEERVSESQNGVDSTLGFIRIGISTKKMRASLRREISFMVLYSFMGIVVFSTTILLLTGKLVRQLKHSLDTTETILKNLPFGMVIVGKDKVIRSINRAAMDVMGLQSDHEVTGKKCHNKICPAQKCSCPVLDLGQAVDSSERSVLDKDGRKIPVMKSVIQINLGGEDVLLEAFVDISESKKAEKALIDSENKMRIVMEACADPIVVYDKQGLTTFVNPAFVRVFGWDPEDVYGKRIEFVPEEAKPEAEQALARVLAGKSYFGTETVRMTKDGRKITVRISAAPIMTDDSAYNGMVVNFQDVTDLVASRQAAEAASAAKSEFLANMSHEIRTPMNGIIGMTELVLGTDLKGDQRKYLEMAKMSADSLLELINEILDFSKIEAGKMELEAIDFNLRVTLENATDTLALKAHEKGLELACHIRPDVPTALIGDPGRLRQIIVNIAGNSLKFTEEGEIVIRVEVASESEDSVKLHFMVSDTGIGIPPDKLDSIFKSFEQVDGSTTRKYGGTGLGLAITRQFVEMMGGEIRVESPNRLRPAEDSDARKRDTRVGGAGSIFHFTLLFERSQSKNIRIPRLATQDLSEMPVLIVDDNSTNRLLLQEMITSWGLVPTIASDGKEAIDRFNQAAGSGTPYRLILLDMQMPELDGFDVAKIIKGAPSGKDVRIILLSSIGQRGDADRCKAVGISGYLHKPIKQSDLFDAVVMTLGIDSEETPTVITRHKIYEERQIFNILLAEDNLVNQTLAIKLLGTQGHHVTLASNGMEAVEEFKKGDFDLILMDIQMPELDGFEATREIRKIETADSRPSSNSDGQSPMHRIPIIAMTAHAMTGDREKCLDAGMDDYVSKPIRPRTLFSVIKKITQESRGEKRQKKAPSKEGSNASSPKTFDLAMAMETVLENEDLFQEIAEIFLDSVPDYLSKVREAVAQQDAGALEQAAHGLKGSAGNFGAEKVSEAALRLERLGKDKTMGTSALDLSDLEAALDELVTEMASVLKGMKK